MRKNLNNYATKGAVANVDKQSTGSMAPFLCKETKNNIGLGEYYKLLLPLSLEGGVISEYESVRLLIFKGL